MSRVACMLARYSVLGQLLKCDIHGTMHIFPSASGTTCKLCSNKQDKVGPHELVNVSHAKSTKTFLREGMQSCRARLCQCVCVKPEGGLRQHHLEAAAGLLSPNGLVRASNDNCMAGLLRHILDGSAQHLTHSFCLVCQYLCQQAAAAICKQQARGFSLQFLTPYFQWDEPKDAFLHMLMRGFVTDTGPCTEAVEAV